MVRNSFSLTLVSILISWTDILPVVMVPVLSKAIVLTRFVDSRICGPRIKTPNCAPRPVPTRSAVGVASPSAHGQAMMRTATAAVNAKVGSSPASSQPTRVARAKTITIGTKTAATLSARR